MTGHQETVSAAIFMMELVSILISRCTIYEYLYLRRDVPNVAEAATDVLRRALLDLYTTIMQALSRWFGFWRVVRVSNPTI